jgi:predicted metal-binding protein
MRREFDLKRIAIVTCKNAASVCTGASCLQAFRERNGSFKQYGSENVELIAFMQCSGCNGVKDQGPFDQGVFPELDGDEGMQKKLDRLLKEKVDVVHLGICCWNSERELCPWMKKFIPELRQRGFLVKSGTHGVNAPPIES